MLYVDDLKARSWCPGATCHLLPQMRTTDDLRELHLLAARLGLARDAFQPRRWPHYRLTRARREQALGLGAVPTSTRGYVAGTRHREAAAGVVVIRLVIGPSMSSPAKAPVRSPSFGMAGQPLVEVLGLQLDEHLRWLDSMRTFDQLSITRLESRTPNQPGSPE